MWSFFRISRSDRLWRVIVLSIMQVDKHLRNPQCEHGVRQTDETPPRHLGGFDHSDNNPDCRSGEGHSGQDGQVVHHAVPNGHRNKCSGHQDQNHHDVVRPGVFESECEHQKQPNLDQHHHLCCDLHLYLS